MAKKTIGQNIEYALDGKILTLTIDISKEFGPSSSGKTIMIASTQGNKDVGDVKIGVNVYKYPDAKPAKGKK
jgi:hypothetical protein